MKQSTLNDLIATTDALASVALRVDADGKAALASGDHVEIIRHYDQLRKVNERIKAARELLSEVADLFSTKHIPDVVAALKEKTGEKPPFNIEGIGKVGVSYRFSCSMADKALGFEWLRAEGHGALIQETVNAQTLAAFAKNIIVEQGGSLPEDIFKVGTAPYTSIRTA